MSTVFTINFRREAYLRELALTRRRLFALGAWVAYFGLLGVILGLYGLNCVSLARRTGQIERQMARMRAVQSTTRDWVIGPEQLAIVQRFESSPRFWRDHLARLAAVIPANAVLTSVAVNPDNLGNPTEQGKLVITGYMKVGSGDDRMRGVVQLVSALHADSAFSAGYSNIRLASSQISSTADNITQFVIECR